MLSFFSEIVPIGWTLVQGRNIFAETRVLSVQCIKILYRNSNDVTIFTQPLQADSTEGLREYCDVKGISVEYFDISNREHSSNRKISST